MDVQTFIALLSIVVTVIGGLLAAVWKQVVASREEHLRLERDLSDVRVHIADTYVKTADLRRILDDVISPVKDDLSAIKVLIDRRFHG